MKQIAGAHYLDMKMQPWEIIDACDLDFYEGNVLKYLLRYKRKGRPKEDLEKLKHYVEKLIARNDTEMTNEKYKECQELPDTQTAYIYSGTTALDAYGKPIVDGNEKFDAYA